MFGGYEGCEVEGHVELSSVISLNPDEGEWQQEPALPFEVVWPEVACVEVNGIIQIFLLNTTVGGTLFMLDMDNKTWIRKTHINVVCSWGAKMIAVHENTLLVTGGDDCCFARYSPDTDTWVTGAAPDVEHHSGVLVNRGESVYLLGGSGQSLVEEYSLESESWSDCEFRLPVSLSGFDFHALVLDV